VDDWWPAYIAKKQADFEILRTQLQNFHDETLEASQLHMEKISQIDLQAMEQEKARQRTLVENAWQFYGDLEEANRQHAYTMISIDEDRGKRITKIEARILAIKRQTQQAYMSLAAAAGNAIIQITQKEGKKQFVMQKAFQVGMAIMDAWLAHNNALAAIPPPANVVVAQAMLTKGLIGAAAIAAQGIGQYAAAGSSGGGGGSAGATGGFGAGVSSPSDLGIAEFEEEPRGELIIHIHGDFIGDEAYIEKMAEKISEAVENRNVTLIASHAVTAEEVQ